MSADERVSHFTHSLPLRTKRVRSLCVRPLPHSLTHSQSLAVSQSASGFLTHSLTHSLTLIGRSVCRSSSPPSSSLLHVLVLVLVLVVGGGGVAFLAFLFFFLAVPFFPLPRRCLCCWLVGWLVGCLPVVGSFARRGLCVALCPSPARSLGSFQSLGVPRCGGRRRTILVRRSRSHPSYFVQSSIANLEWCLLCKPHCRFVVVVVVVGCRLIGCVQLLDERCWTQWQSTMCQHFVGSREQSMLRRAGILEILRRGRTAQMPIK